MATGGHMESSVSPPGPVVGLEYLFKVVLYSVSGGLALLQN